MPSSHKQKLIQFLIKPVLAYVVLVAALFLLQRCILYKPHGEYQPPHSRGLLNTQELYLPTADAHKALAWYAPAPDDKKLIVYFHGNGGNLGYATNLLKKIRQAGFGYIAPEYRGYPGYDGSTNEAGIYNDARAVMDFAINEGYAPKDIILFGRSLGTGVAVQMATEYDVGLVALVSPFTAIADAAAEIYWYMPVQYLVLDRFDSYDKIADVTAPILIFHSDDDTLIPIALGQRLYDKATAQKRFFTLQEQGHNRIDFGFVLQHIVEFSNAQATTTIPQQQSTPQ